MSKLFRTALILSVALAVLVLLVVALQLPAANGNPKLAGERRPEPSATVNPKCFRQTAKCEAVRNRTPTTDTGGCANRLSLQISDRCYNLRGSMTEQRRERNNIPLWRLRYLCRCTA